ncbi:MAG: iron-sulfur cluster assembly scaffold protein [Candidatus Acidiferrales bacterium]
MFNQRVLEHFRNPHNAGDLPGATATVELSNPVCGDVMRLAVRLESGRISDARFRTQGCVAAIAAGSVLTDLLAGKSAVEAAAVSAGEISDALGGLPPASMHAAQLCRDVVEALTRKL